METAQRLGAVFVASCEADYPLPPCGDRRCAAADRGARQSGGAGAPDGRDRRFAQRIGAPASKFAERLARELGDAGFVIASGLARGIDAAAHRASLATGTVAVLAGGQDRIYPQEHAGLLDALLAEGAAVSEMPFGWEPRARDFPRRNRIISGLSLGVVIVEAAKRSGSLITARLALEQGREVFAVPGSPIDPRAEGTNGLLKQGATLVTEAADVIAVVEPILGQRTALAAREPDGDGGIAMPAEPEGRGPRAHSRSCSGPRRSGSTIWSACRTRRLPSVRMVLLELELAGRIERQGGGLVALI